jgi:hypothetical protein
MSFNQNRYHGGWRREPVSLIITSKRPPSIHVSPDSTFETQATTRNFLKAKTSTNKMKTTSKSSKLPHSYCQVHLQTTVPNESTRPMIMATLGADGQDEVPASSSRSHQATIEEEAEEITFVVVDNVGEVEIPTSSTPPFQAKIEDEVEESSSVETGNRPPKYTDLDPSPSYPEMRVTENVWSTSLEPTLRY